MEFASLRYLLMVADAGSFAKAAVQLGLNASTLTRRVGALEDELGLTLLERSRAGVKLASGGSTVVVEIGKMLADLESVTKAARRNGTRKVGELRLGVRMPPVGEPLSTLFSRWRTDHPGVVLTLCELTDHELRTAIESHRLDAAFPSGHPLATKTSVGWHGLRTETILVQEWPESRIHPVRTARAPRS